MTATGIAPVAVRFAPRRPWSVPQVVRSFYRQPIGWVSAVMTAAILTYGGGIIMFWFHAIHRGEKGPAISDQAHWFLDSTLGFVGLLPVVVLLLPLASALAGAPRRSTAARRAAFAVVVGALFALATAPGPFLHNAIAGADTPLAEAVTSIVGEDSGVMARNQHAHGRSPVEEGLLQVLVGLPVYTACGWLAGRSIEMLAARRVQLRRAPHDESHVLVHRGTESLAA